MSTFAYTAIGRDGRQAAGTLSADSRSAAIAQVVQRGLHPVSVKEKAADKPGKFGKPAKPAKAANGSGRPSLFGPAGGTGAADGNGAAAPAATAAASTGAMAAFDRWRQARVSQRAVEAFTRELANLLSGGVSLGRSMSLLRRESSNANAKRLWAALHDDVVGGTSLADAMAKFPKSFSSVYVAMVRAGEAGGFLDVVLAQIADFRARESDLKGKVKAAMIYPIILTVLGTGVVTFLLTWFIPKFTGVFKEFGGSLPVLTQVIVAVSHVVTNFGPYVAAFIVLLVIALWYAVRTDTGRRRFERILLAVPFLGRVIAHFALVRFARMLGTLTGAGVPLVASLKTAREAIGNQTLADTVTHAIEQVQRGSALSKALGENARLFPPSVVETIAVAEETGRLDKELVRVAGTYETDLDRQLRTLVSVAEPMLLLIMASVIGTVVVGMLLPVFNLQNLIK